MLLSFVVWKVLPDSPEAAKFLTTQEKEFIINRLALETGSGQGRVTNADRIRLHHIVAAFKDWRIWCGVICFWANTIRGLWVALPGCRTLPKSTLRRS